MLGEPVTMPVAIAPAAIGGLQVANGEILAARAAERFGVPFALSTMSICSIEDVAEGTSKPFWFQVYVIRDRDFMERLIARTIAAKCSALILTMDHQIQGQRHKDLRNGLSAPPKFTASSLFQMATRPGWSLGMLGAKRRTFSNIIGHAAGVDDIGALSTWVRQQFDPTLSWKEVGWLKDRFDGPVVVKGVLDVEDAQAAVNAGADAIVVSNHGGRQLDGAPSSIRVLPQIIDAVGHKIDVFIDGGVRSGQDVLKSLALGAKGAFIGRPMLYGLGAGGEAGVTRALEILRKEIDITMALLGERDVANVGPHNIYSNDLLRGSGY